MLRMCKASKVLPPPTQKLAAIPPSLHESLEEPAFPLDAYGSVFVMMEHNPSQLFMSMEGPLQLLRRQPCGDRSIRTNRGGR